MAKTRLSNAKFVKRGYVQVEPNHLSAQRTGQIYAQLPADKDIDFLENGQFVKYDYVNGLVNFTGAGEWMLCYNAIKLYREYQADCDFAMIKENYGAKVYSVVEAVDTQYHSRDYQGVVTPADPYEVDSTDDPFLNTRFKGPQMMPTGTTMVPRVFKTNVGDIYTTNTVDETALALGDILSPNAQGYLVKVSAPNADDEAAMKWQVVKVYTMPDGQPGVKIMRIA